MFWYDRQTRSNAWDSGPADPENSYPLLPTRLRNRALHQAALSDDVLTVEDPALQRLLLKGWVSAEWKLTETNRRARYYTLTAAGRKQLGIELSEYEQLITAIGRVLQSA